MNDRSKQQPVLVEIDSLELIGFPRSRAEAIARAAESHLATLLRDQGLSTAPRGGRELRATAAPLDPAAPSSIVGSRVAEAVFAALQPSHREGQR